MSKILELKELDKSFGGVHAVNHVSFHVNEGEILGLIGPNGSGKSTCVNLISGVEIQDSGKIIFDGHELKRQKVPDRALMGMGRTFQSPRPFLNMTPWESVYTIALRYSRSNQEAKEKTEKVLEMMNFNDVVYEVSSKLPIERRKWLDMARVLVTNPKLIMLDECLAGLLPNELEESLNLIRKINDEGITILFIEHVMSAVVALCHRVVVLNEGTLLCEGKPADVMNNVAVIKAYLGEDYAYAENQ